ncbi:TonB family protein [Chryseobacterium sp. SORGH_AS 447]|uniref:energy transducer TonB n=1 Tax=Chryseobacterium sp. SORGH_AS_0447 TaxID=3041769 RepID=UPI00277E1CA7|nr:energy transducer TonB [Chryseobacterium sp. SORGH_AS_0447]MDQ1159863.1 TonB family protein [Chryseobacterium sp. SORGH_AS_0447]
MIRKFLFLSITGCFLSVSGQTVKEEVFRYPRAYEAYEGGDVQFYKDFHQILMEKNLTPCENKEEYYQLKVRIDENDEIALINDDFNSQIAKNNKCAYELSIQVLKNMNRWKPLIIDGKKKTAVKTFFIKPNTLFENYKEDYVPDEKIAAMEGDLPGGINKFREEVAKRIDVDGFVWQKPFKIVVVFVVTREGKIGEVKLEQSSGVPEFDNRIINGIKSIKKKWAPAKIDGTPVDYRFRLPLNFGPM